MFWVLNAYNTYDLQIFSPFLYIVFLVFLIISFESQKIDILMKSNLFTFSFALLAFGVKSKNPLPNPRL